MTKCLVENCYHQASAQYRGLCLRCFGRAKRAVEDGTVTWEELVGLGLALEESGSADPFTNALRNKLEGN